MKTADMAELKARLGEYQRAVCRGDTIAVTENGILIATIVPARTQGLRIRKPTGKSIHQVPLPPPLHLEIDIVDLLMEER